MSRKYVAVSLTAALILLACTASAATRTVTLKVDGMTCGGCATTVERALKETAGVEDAQVNYERGQAVVRYDDRKVTLAKLREVIQSTGFSCEVKR